MMTDSLPAEYDRWHEAFAGQDDPRALRFFDWILALLQVADGESLLDVACGQGAFIEHAARCGLRVSGVDLSEVAVAAARTRLPSADVRVADAQRLPFGDSSMDRVTCLGSLEHFPDPHAGAREIARVLSDEGIAVIFLPNLFFLGHVYFGLRFGTQPSEGEQAFSERYLSTEGWAELLRQSGLAVQSRHPWNHIYATRKVRPVVVRLWNMLSPLVPDHGAYAHAYVCVNDVSLST
jgi:ubiquinone/menaquinone biosynthesis C-methylase UbiE